VDEHFDVMRLEGTNLDSPTSLQFGPDNRLYVSQQNGLIQVYSVSPRPEGGYEVTASESISAIQEIPNHDDDGIPQPDVRGRLVTGLLVVGTVDRPVVYVTSSDPRLENPIVDTNSGTISRLIQDGNGWKREDLVRGLPRSRYDHAPNGLQLDPERSILYVAQGGNTNAGAPATLMGRLPEYALSGAVLAIDLTRLSELPYDLPTLDDEDRPGNPDENDPFGGNSGKNQAILVPGGPVQIYATGFRNAYDLVRTDKGFYLTDNGANQNFGSAPRISAEGKVTNELRDAGERTSNSLHHIAQAGYYGGTPNPTRANRQNTFNERMPQSPVEFEDPAQGHFLLPGAENGALILFTASTNGITVYNSSDFGPPNERNLLTVGLDATVRLTKLDSSGEHVTEQIQLLKGGGALFLDVVAQSDDDPYPGTIWVADYGLGTILVLQPGANSNFSSRLSSLSRRGQKSVCDGYLSGREWVMEAPRRVRVFVLSTFREYFGAGGSA
jgi:WD40 repeat protein